MKVLLRERDLSDDYIRFAAQIGADGFDIHGEKNVPGVEEKGYADAAGMRASSTACGAGAWASTAWPPTPRRYLLGESGGEQELDDLCRTLEALGQAGVLSCPRPCTWGSTPATGGHQGRPPRAGTPCTRSTWR